MYIILWTLFLLKYYYSDTFSEIWAGINENMRQLVEYYQLYMRVWKKN